MTGHDRNARANGTARATVRPLLGEPSRGARIGAGKAQYSYGTISHDKRATIMVKGTTNCRTCDNGKRDQANECRGLKVNRSRDSMAGRGLRVGARGGLRAGAGHVHSESVLL